MVNLVIERHLEIQTAEGSMTTYVVHPEGPGPFPVVLFLMDAPGKRPLLHSMAQRIADNGYYVMLPNLYYRTTPAFELDFSSKESFQRMSELMRTIGNRMVVRDASELLTFAENESVADISAVEYAGADPEKSAPAQKFFPSAHNTTTRQSSLLSSCSSASATAEIIRYEK